MINIYFSQGVVSKVVWSIMKGSSGVPEDFSRAVVKVWLISEDDKINASAETTVEDGKIVIDLSAVNHSIDYPLLPANVYSMKALWWKDENMQKLSVAEVHNAFAVTSYQEEATPFTGDELTIRVKSPAATYGYDGLSAYEIACMRGTTTALSEKEWVQIRASEIEENQIADGAITTPKLADGAVTTDKIQDFDDSATDPTGVTTNKLADSAVTTPKIADTSVTTDKVVDAAVTTPKIADGAVTTAKILDGNVTRDKINTSAVATEKIANEAVTTAKIADGAVTTAKLADGSVTEDKLADDAVTTDKIHDGAVTTGKIENSAITTDKLHDAAITNQKIANGTLTGAKFADGSITGTKIADNTVPGSKLQDGTITGVDLQDNSLPGRKLVDSSVDGAKIADGAIESRHLKDNSIPAEKIKDGTIENVDIKDGTLSGEKIKDNTIQSAKFADGAIGTSKIVDNSVTTDKLDSGAVTAAKIVDGAVTSVKINSGAVTTGKIADEAVTEDKLADGAVTTAKLSDGMIEEIQTITDAEPTSGSVKPVQSGGVQNELALGAVYDVSAKNPTAGPNSDGKWESLSALLSDANLNTLIPTAYRKGGMSIKFIQSSDNKYVQYRLMADSFNTTPTNWQGVDDEPTAGSDNLVKSCGVFNLLIKLADINGTQARIEVGDVYYNNNIKQIRKKTGASTYDILPFYPGAIYTFNEDFYIWNGTDLVKKTITVDNTPTIGSSNPVESNGVFVFSRENKEIKHSATSIHGTAFKEYYFGVAVGDKIKVTINNAADYGVYVRISQDGGSTWVKTYDALWEAQTIELEITHNGQLWVTIPSNNITNVTTSIVLENLYYKFENINASSLKYTDNHGLGADTVQEGIDELAKRTDCIGHNIFKTTDDSWAVGSSDQKAVVVDSSKRYRVRVLSTNPVSYYVGRYNQSWSGTNYDRYTDNNWHEIPMLSDTSWLVLTSTIVTLDVTIEVEEIGVEIYDNKLILPKHTYKVRKSGGRDFTSLLEACIEACEYTDSEVFVEEGTYDLIQEFESYYGSDFFTNYTSNSVVGIRLYNRVHLVFATNAVVTFNYEGNNEYVHTIFSPFNSYFASGGGFKIENLHIRAKNCRYCIHDEKDSSNDSYHHAYINCDMYMDNSNNPDWESKQCIGGGLGKDGYIEVVGCSFETVTNNADETAFSWHNCGSSGTAKSRLNIRDNYVKKGTFTLLWVGTTTAITKAYVSGNSFTAQPKHQSGGGSVENTELISWNNEIRV